MAQSSKTIPSYGTVEITGNGIEESASLNRPSRTLQMHVTSYRWTLPPDLQEGFLLDFSVDLRAYLPKDGEHRFLPTDGIDFFIDQAFAAGLAMLTRDKPLSKEETSTYRAMKLIFDRVRSMKEHMGREFGYARDLYIRRSGRESDSQRSVLPNHLGLTATGEGRKWSPKLLCDKGRTRAREMGVERLTNHVAISYGFLAAAELNPLDIQDSEDVASLVRMALFSPAEEDETLSEDCLSDVYAKLTDLLNSHRLDTEEEFQRWYAGSNSNLFKAIAGKDLSAGVVRKAILHLGWQAYEYVSGCVSYFIGAFVRSLPLAPSCDERKLLEHMYQPQPYLGGLPLIFLLERKQILSPVIRQLWGTPGDPRAIRVLHRLFEYYAAMTPIRRRADLQSKQRKSQVEIADSDLADSLSKITAGISMEQILNKVIERRGLCCDQCDRQPECKIKDNQNLRTAEITVVLEYWCQDHNNRRETEVSTSELHAVADELGIKEPD